MRVVIAGGSGFIGAALTQLFRNRGDDVVILSRSTRSIEGATLAKWNGETVGDWSGLLNGAAAVINLSGEPVTLRWTEENRRKILESRTKSTEAIGKAIRSCQNAPITWINVSGVGYYGDAGDTLLDESSPAGEGFLSEVCLAWERAQESVDTPGTRKARIRIGTVLGRDGGAFPELAKFAKLFLGGTLGSGHQWMPWIHIEDLARIFAWVVDTKFEGVVNGVGPEPVKNTNFMAALRHAAKRPWSPPVPAFAIRTVGAIKGVQADVVLQSQRATSRVLAEAGFTYDHPSLDQTLKSLLAAPSDRP